MLLLMQKPTLNYVKIWSVIAEILMELFLLLFLLMMFLLLLILETYVLSFIKNEYVIDEISVVAVIIVDAV